MFSPYLSRGEVVRDLCQKCVLGGLLNKSLSKARKTKKRASRAMLFAVVSYRWLFIWESMDWFVAGAQKKKVEATKPVENVEEQG